MLKALLLGLYSVFKPWTIKTAQCCWTRKDIVIKITLTRDTIEVVVQHPRLGYTTTLYPNPYSKEIKFADGYSESIENTDGTTTIIYTRLSPRLEGWVQDRLTFTRSDIDRINQAKQEFLRSIAAETPIVAVPAPQPVTALVVARHEDPDPEIWGGPWLENVMQRLP